MFGVMQHLDVSVFKDAEEATAHGFKYERPEFSPIEVTKAVVVNNGTASGRPTVDLILADEHGKQYVVMLTGNLVNMLAACAR